VISEFCRDLQRILACVSQAVVLWRPQADDNFSIVLSEEPVRLDAYGEVIDLLVRLRVQVRAGLVVPLAYRYELRDAQGKEIIAWHLHDQQGQRYPHLHTRLLPEQYDHVPTGIVGLADIVWMLVNESGVSARRADWRTVLLPLLRRLH